MESGRHRVLVHSPILCGLVLYHFRSKMYNLGIAIMNSWGSITYPAHLYNALRNEGLLHGQWKDMDVVQTLLGSFNALFAWKSVGGVCALLQNRLLLSWSLQLIK
jgi:hypothetical protein